MLLQLGKVDEFYAWKENTPLNLEINDCQELNALLKTPLEFSFPSKPVTIDYQDLFAFLKPHIHSMRIAGSACPKILTRLRFAQILQNAVPVLANVLDQIDASHIKEDVEDIDTHIHLKPSSSLPDGVDAIVDKIIVEHPFLKTIDRKNRDYVCQKKHAFLLYHPQFKIQNGKVIQDGHRILCKDNSRQKHDILIFRTVLSTKRVIFQDLYLELRDPDHPTVIGSLQAVLDKFCRLIRWENLNNATHIDWAVHQWYIAKGGRSVDPKADEILKAKLMNFIHGSTNLSEKIFQVLLDRLNKPKKEDPSSQGVEPSLAFSFMFNACSCLSKDTPAHTTDKIWEASLPYFSELNDKYLRLFVNPSQGQPFSFGVVYALLHIVAFYSALTRSSLRSHYTRHAGDYAIQLEVGKSCFLFPINPAESFRVFSETYAQMNQERRIDVACILEMVPALLSDVQQLPFRLPVNQLIREGIKCLSLGLQETSKHGYHLLLLCFALTPTDRLLSELLFYLPEVVRHTYNPEPILQEISAIIARHASTQLVNRSLAGIQDYYEQHLHHLIKTDPDYAFRLVNRLTQQEAHPSLWVKRLQALGETTFNRVLEHNSLGWLCLLVKLYDRQMNEMPLIQEQLELQLQAFIATVVTAKSISKGIDFAWLVAEQRLLSSSFFVKIAMIFRSFDLKKISLEANELIRIRRQETKTTLLPAYRLLFLELVRQWKQQGGALENKISEACKEWIFAESDSAQACDLLGKMSLILHGSCAPIWIDYCAQTLQNKGIDETFKAWCYGENAVFWVRTDFKKHAPFLSTFIEQLWLKNDFATRSLALSLWPPTGCNLTPAVTAELREHKRNEKIKRLTAECELKNVRESIEALLDLIHFGNEEEADNVIALTRLWFPQLSQKENGKGAQEARILLESSKFQRLYDSLPDEYIAMCLDCMEQASALKLDESLLLTLRGLKKFNTTNVASKQTRALFSWIYSPNIVFSVPLKKAIHEAQEKLITILFDHKEYKAIVDLIQLMAAKGISFHPVQKSISAALESIIYSLKQGAPIAPLSQLPTNWPLEKISWTALDLSACCLIIDIMFINEAFSVALLWYESIVQPFAPRHEELMALLRYTLIDWTQCIASSQTTSHRTLHSLDYLQKHFPEEKTYLINQLCGVPREAIKTYPGYALRLMSDYFQTSPLIQLNEQAQLLVDDILTWYLAESTDKPHLQKSLEFIKASQVIDNYIWTKVLKPIAHSGHSALKKLAYDYANARNEDSVNLKIPQTAEYEACMLNLLASIYAESGDHAIGLQLAGRSQKLLLFFETSPPKYYKVFFTIFRGVIRRLQTGINPSQPCQDLCAVLLDILQKFSRFPEHIENRNEHVELVLDVVDVVVFSSRFCDFLLCCEILNNLVQDEPQPENFRERFAASIAALTLNAAEFPTEPKLKTIIEQLVIFYKMRLIDLCDPLEQIEALSFYADANFLGKALRLAELRLQKKCYIDISKNKESGDVYCNLIKRLIQSKPSIRTLERGKLLLDDLKTQSLINEPLEQTLACELEEALQQQPFYEFYTGNIGIKTISSMMIFKVVLIFFYSFGTHLSNLWSKEGANSDDIA